MQEYVDGLFPKIEPHPARALYALWKRVLEIQNRREIPWTRQGYGIALNNSDDDGAIIFGPQWLNGGTADRFTLLPDGRFQMRHYWGCEQRKMVAQGIPFLAWGHTAGSYCWTVAFDEASKNGWGMTRLDDWQNPRHYVAEPMMGVRHWSTPDVWLELRQIEGEWRILPSDQQDYHRWTSWTPDVVREQLLKVWERQERLIAKRYNRREYLWRKYHQPDEEMPEHLLPKRRRKAVPSLREGGKTLTGHEATHRLAALLEVSQPAKTTPLKRPKEAQHGNHLDTPHHV